jgi:hypothetical protein
MRDASVISRLRGALRRQGVWGGRAERLIQEWTEHVRDDAAHRIEKGADPDAAQKAAWLALGSQEVLAASAAREFARGSWLGRHPWIGGMVLPALGWVAVIAAVVCIPGLLVFPSAGDADFLDSARLVPALVCWEQAVNWIPWLISIAWLAWIAARMPGGWKLYWITAVVLMLCAPSVEMKVHPPSHGPHTGLIYIYFPGGMPGMISSTIQHVLGHLPLIGPRFQAWVDGVLDAHRPLVPKPPQTVAWIQTTIMAFGAITFYLRMTANPGRTGAPIEG